MTGYNDLATTDTHLLSEWDYERNKDIFPNKISRNSMQSVWSVSYTHLDVYKRQHLNGLRTEKFITTAELILPAQALWELLLLRLPTVLLLQPTAVEMCIRDRYIYALYM